MSAQLARGRLMTNSDPFPGSLDAVMVPPCASTMARVMASPMPDPPVARAREESAR